MFDPSYRQLSIKLDKLAPRFDLPSGSIKVLTTPEQFYATLKHNILNAQRRIFLSTLYIGRSEHELIDTLRSALQQNQHLCVSILTDALRGTREAPKPCCASLLAPLISEFGASRVELRMYHTPNLHGLRKRLIGRRFDEGWGLQHMKLYGVDDKIILSGANLSNDYFTDRQDRYHVFSSKPLTNFYERLHDAVCSISYQVVPKDIKAGFALEWTADCPEPVQHPKLFKRYATKLIYDQIRATPLKSCDFTADRPPTTIVYPSVQLSPLLEPHQSTEQPAVNAVLDMLTDPAHRKTVWHFTAGYFNVYKDYRTRLLKALGHGTIMTASPDANGFYKSPGPSGMLAAGYTLLSLRFLRDVAKNGRTESIALREWKKGVYGSPDRWTYHAKGLWLHPNSEESVGPSLTFIGSSNLTRRSQSLDLEATAIVITAEPELQKDFGKELAHLQQYTKKVSIADLETPDRRADLKTRIALWLCQGML